MKARLIRAALSLAPGVWNPAWRYGDVIRTELGPAARIAIDPRRVIGKIGRRQSGNSEQFERSERRERLERPERSEPSQRPDWVLS